MATNIPPFPPFAYPFTNITPFLQRDGDTYLTVLEKMAAYLRNLADQINEHDNEFYDEIIVKLNETLTLVNDALQQQTEHVDSEISDLVDYVNAQVQSIINNSIELQDTVAAGLIATPGSETQTQLNAAIVAEGGTVFALKDEIPEGIITSNDFESFIISSDPDVISNPPVGAVVLTPGPPDGPRSDFLVGPSEVQPVWASNINNLTHIEGSILRYSGESTNGRYGFVLSGATGMHRNVDMVARVRYTAVTTGMKCLVFARGTGVTGAENMIFAGIQTRGVSDAAEDGGLRLNAYVNGAFSVVPPGVQTIANAPWRNTVDTFYYIRLRVAKDTLVAAKQWIATDPEPANWDLALAPGNIPAEFKEAGGSAQGLCGFMADQFASPQDFDYFAVTFDGSSAPLKEAL